jgi:hypothetical protein
MDAKNAGVALGFSSPLDFLGFPHYGTSGISPISQSAQASIAYLSGLKPANANAPIQEAFLHAQKLASILGIHAYASNASLCESAAQAPRLNAMPILSLNALAAVATPENASAKWRQAGASCMSAARIDLYGSSRKQRIFRWVPAAPSRHPFLEVNGLAKAKARCTSQKNGQDDKGRLG